MPHFPHWQASLGDMNGSRDLEVGLLLLELAWPSPEPKERLRGPSTPDTHTASWMARSTQPRRQGKKFLNGEFNKRCTATER